jgi:hypothetical protein
VTIALSGILAAASKFMLMKTSKTVFARRGPRGGFPRLCFDVFLVHDTFPPDTRSLHRFSDHFVSNFFLLIIETHSYGNPGEKYF